MEQSSKLDRVRADYNVHYWSQGFFGIDNQGEVYVSPRKDGQYQTQLSSIVSQLETRGLNLPVLVRFPQILHQRVHNICDAFNQAIDEYDYPNKYLLVYPIKVNQQREVVDDQRADEDEQQACVIHRPPPPTPTAPPTAPCAPEPTQRRAGSRRA